VKLWHRGSEAATAARKQRVTSDEWQVASENIRVLSVAFGAREIEEDGLGLGV